MRPPFSRTLFELVCEQAERFPERIAVICGGRVVSYRDLADGAGRIAAALKAHGIGRGERVGLLVNNRLEWLESCFGAAALGAISVPFSTWSKPAELAHLLADSEVSALIAIDRFGRSGLFRRDRRNRAGLPGSAPCRDARRRHPAGLDRL